MLHQVSLLGKVSESGLYRVSNSHLIPSGTYWIEVATSGRNKSLSLFKQRSGCSIGFIDICNGKPWHGFFKGEMIPCCDLRTIKIAKIPQRQLVVA